MPTPTPTLSPTQRKSATIGETIERVGIQFTLDSIERYIDTSDWQLDKAEEGNEIILLWITIRNNTNDDVYLNMFYEKSYLDGFAVSPKFILTSKIGESWSGDIAAGKAKKGYIAYEVPIGWNEIEFQYDMDTWSSSKGNKIILLATNTLPPAPAPTPTPAPPQDKIATIGDTIEREGIQFTFDKIERYSDTSRYQWDKAEDGNEFIVLWFTIKNSSSEDYRVSSAYEESYLDGFTIKTKSLYNVDGETWYGNIAAGMAKKGYIAYEVPIGWNKIEFQYKPGYGAKESKLIFIATKDNIN